MTDKQFEALLDRVMDGVPADPELQVLRKYSAEELQRMAPLIDDMVEQAFKAGQLQGMLEILARQKERRKEIASGVPF